MSNSGATSASQRERVASGLEALCASPQFSGAPRLTAFLRYIVEAELDGTGGDLNQTKIAVEVMGRGPGYDPAVDSAVRVEAGRLRTKLREYYQGGAGADQAIRFELPKGTYRPTISFGAEHGPAGPTRGEAAPPQDIGFCRAADGTAIAYAVSGDGPPMVKAANWLSHLEFDHQSPVWSHWWSGLARRFRLVRYDERGCGLSDWNTDDFTLDTWVDDLEIVTDECGLEKFVLLGISQGASVAVDYAVRHPERVSHLILYGGFLQGRLVRDTSPEMAEEAKMLQDLARIGWGKNHQAFRRIFASLFIPDATGEQVTAFDDLQRVTTSPENATRFLEAFNSIDALETAARVTVPTLVLHARDENEIPVEQARLAAATIPGAKFVPLDSRNHILGETEPAWIKFLAEVEKFVGAR